MICKRKRSAQFARNNCTIHSYVCVCSVVPHCGSTRRADLKSERNRKKVLSWRARIHLYIQYISFLSASIASHRSVVVTRARSISISGLIMQIASHGNGLHTVVCVRCGDLWLLFGSYNMCVYMLCAIHGLNEVEPIQTLDLKARTSFGLS